MANTPTKKKSSPASSRTATPSTQKKPRRTLPSPSPPLIVTTPSTTNLSEDSWSTSSGGSSTAEKDTSQHLDDPVTTVQGRRNLFPHPPKLRSRKVLQELYSWTVEGGQKGGIPTDLTTTFCYCSDEDRQRPSAHSTPDSYSGRHKRKAKPPPTNKWMAFLLCCIGLSSVSMLLVANHRIMPEQQHDHVAAVLFQHGVVKQQRTHTSQRVNLNQLAHFQRGGGQEGQHQQPPSPHHDRTVDTKPSHHHHHQHETTHDKKKEKHHAAAPLKEEVRLYTRPLPLEEGLIRVALPSGSLLESHSPHQDNDKDLYRSGSSSTFHRVVSIAPFMPTSRKTVTVQEFPADYTDETQYYSRLDSNDERVSATMERREPLEDDSCVPMQKWQTEFHPSCNGMHELDMASMGSTHTEDDYKLFGMKGFWRNAWRLDSIGGHQRLEERDTVVLKTLRINHRFEDSYYENNRIDAVVLERLTASPHVINVFGFCGHSVLTEFADGKRLGELADKKRKEPLARLSIARDIANGLADVHSIDGDGNATFVHFDINPANVVSIGGTLKLNDFNIGVLRRWNTTSNTACGIPAQYPNPQWRSPEEAREEQNLTEKIDVFSLGHILFRLICRHEPWHKLEPGGMPTKEELNEKVKQGILPTIPKHVLESTDPEIVAIRDAMLRCYVYEPTKRPSAREIASSLQKALDELEKPKSSLRSGRPAK